MRKYNIKTLQRFFSVLGVIVTVLMLFSMVTPLTYADNITESSYNSLPVSSSPYNLKIDFSFPSITSYFYGTNSGIIDYVGADSQFHRIIINNNLMRAVLNKDSSNKYWISVKAIDNSSTMNNSRLYYTTIGSSYDHFTSGTWNVSVVPSNTFASFQIAGNMIWVRCANSPVSTDLPSSSLNNFYINCYYPLSNEYRDQSAVAEYYHEVDQSERRSIAASQEAAANSRQSEIIEAGSDVTVSTIDNWVDGEGGLAQKLTQLAATLSSNAAVFSENQVSNQENLSKAGAFVNGVFNEFPVGVIAALICFLIMLIAVKVVGR